MRWLCSDLVGADCWLAVGSDKPSNSPPSSPEEEDDESHTQFYNQACWRHLSEYILHHLCASSGVKLTHSEVNVAFAPTHDQECFGLRGRCVRGFRWRVIRAWVCGAWGGHRLTCDKKSNESKDFASTVLHKCHSYKWHINSCHHACHLPGTVAKNLTASRCPWKHSWAWAMEQYGTELPDMAQSELSSP